VALSGANLQHKRPESVLVVVYVRGGRVLLLRRTDHPEFWQSVTGSLRWEDETPLQAAARELREETGIDAGAMLRDWQQTFRYSIFPQWRHRYAPGTEYNTEHVFGLELDAEAPVMLNPREHTDYVWLDREDAAARTGSWSNREAILRIGAV
jgi:dATP pyrophosphohydrolase